MEEHYTQINPKEIIDFINLRIPVNFNKYNINSRISFYYNINSITNLIQLKSREKISVQEIITEFYRLQHPTRSDYIKVNNILLNTKELIKLGRKPDNIYGESFQYKIIKDCDTE